MSTGDRPMSVAERIAALQKKSANPSACGSDEKQTSRIGRGDAESGASGSHGGDGKKRVSSLAGDLSAKLNMNALLGAPPRTSRGGGGGGPAASNSATASNATASAALSTVAQNGFDDGAKFQHVPRALIPPGRRKRRGVR
mmetsp:Transcript_7106/g.15520  ORF Transcript_7106/g.15520 Transcript_7106/m.15520 type:complete len:141 (-) Transcript_7106:2121-2543(-)